MDSPISGRTSAAESEPAVRLVPPPRCLGVAARRQARAPWRAWPGGQGSHRVVSNLWITSPGPRCPTRPLWVRLKRWRPH